MRRTAGKTHTLYSAACWHKIHTLYSAACWPKQANADCYDSGRELRS
jgi:hypothetical protein